MTALRIGFLEPRQHAALIDLLHEMNAHYNGGTPAVARAVAARHLHQNLLGPTSALRLVVASIHGSDVAGFAAIAMFHSLVDPDPLRIVPSGCTSGSRARRSRLWPAPALEISAAASSSRSPAILGDPMKFTVIASILAACILATSGMPAAADTGRLTLGAASLQLPAEGAWTRVAGGARHVLLEQGTAARPIALEFGVQTLSEAPSAQRFMSDTEAGLQSRFSAWSTLSVHYYYMRSGDATCVRYDGLFEDAAAASDRYITLRGQSCQDPGDHTRAASFELSQRSDNGAAARAIDLTSLTERLAQGLTFAPSGATAPR